MPVAGEVRDHQARCLSHLISLRMLAQGEAGVPLPRWAAAEVAQATGAVLAEAEAASRDALAAGRGRQNPVDETSLRGRLDRLATVADDAISAARDGNFAVMGRHLRRFDVLTTAIWTVQQAVYDQAPPSTPR